MLELEHEFRIVDVHVRLDADVGGTAGDRLTVGPETLEREMAQAGVVRAVTFPGPSPSSYLQANNAVARHAATRPFVALARINGPRDVADTPVARLRNLTASREDRHVTPDDVERYAYDDRFAGFRLDPQRDGLPDAEVLDTLDEVDLPVSVHVGEGFPPAAVEETLLRRSFPVILAHFGGYPLVREYMTDAIDLLARHDACYLDTSVVRYRDVLERALREHPDRVLFGSGAPDVHPDVGVMEILTLDVPQDAMRRAFEKNPRRVVPELE